MGHRTDLKFPHGRADTCNMESMKTINTEERTMATPSRNRYRIIARAKGATNVAPIGITLWANDDADAIRKAENQVRLTDNHLVRLARGPRPVVYLDHIDYQIDNITTPED